MQIRRSLIVDMSYQIDGIRLFNTSIQYVIYFMMISLLPQKVFVTLLIDWGLLKLNFPNQKKQQVADVISSI